MSKRMVAGLGYAAAVMTLAVALLVPFVLMGGISSLVARAGLHVDPMYTGGAGLRTLPVQGYSITVYEPVHPHLLQRGEAFQQVAFAPASALPAHVVQTIDMDGDGQPDLRVAFDVPADATAPLHGTVVALNSKFQSLPAVGNESFTRLLAHTGDRIVLRVPLGK